MASCTSPSSLMLTGAATSVRPQDFSPSRSPRCFDDKPLSRAFSGSPVVLKPRGTDPGNWIDVNFLRRAEPWSYHDSVVAMASKRWVTESEEDWETVERMEGGDLSITDDTFFETPQPTKWRERMGSIRFLLIKGLSEKKKQYDLKTGISLLKEKSNTKFAETVKAHFSLNIDPKQDDQKLRATVNLPKGTGQIAKVAVIAQGEKLCEAKNAGADLVGGEDLIERIKGGFMQFDKLIASPEMMPKVASLGATLGRRGLMPNPRAGTVTFNIPKLSSFSGEYGEVEFGREILMGSIWFHPSKGTKSFVSQVPYLVNQNPLEFTFQAVAEYKHGKIEYKTDKTGIVHLTLGKIDFPEEDLLANLIVAARSVEANKPSGVRVGTGNVRTYAQKWGLQ